MKKSELKQIIQEVIQEYNAQPSVSFSVGQPIRVVKDAAGDLPKSIIGRRGKIYRRREDQDDVSNRGPVKAYEINVDGRKRTYFVWEDEISKL